MIGRDDELPGALRVFADSTRLRMMGLLERQELSVGELSRSLGMAQSRVSNHLRTLREAGLVAERHAGTSTFLSLAQPRNGRALAGRLWDTVRGELDGLTEHPADLTRLDGILAERRAQSGEFFDRLAGEWDKIGVDFETGQARQRAIASLLPDGLVLADLGCGTAYFGRALVGLASHLICVDRSEAMLEEARLRLGDRSAGTRLDFRAGDLDRLPIEDGELDGLVAGMVLHHLPSLEKPLAEMLRVLRPGGRAVVAELAPHRETWMQSELGDRRLGLEPRDVVVALERAGFDSVEVDPLADHYRPAPPDGERVRLPLYLVRARRPHAPDKP